MLQVLKAWWHDHGTKILGYIGIVIGSLGEALVWIQQVDPKHAALWGLVITLSIAVVRRGFSNSVRIDP